MTSLYSNSEGSRKTTSSIYANIDVVQKQIFKIYTWNKYNVLYDYSSCVTITGSDSWNVSGAIGIYYSSSYSTSNNGFKLGYSSSINASSYYQSPSDMVSLLSGKYIMIANESGIRMYYNMTSCIFINSNSCNLYFEKRYRYDSSKATVSKGNYLDQIISTNLSLYPSNGIHSDGYWYELV